MYRLPDANCGRIRIHDKLTAQPTGESARGSAPVSLSDAYSLFMQRNRSSGFTDKTLKFYRCQLTPLIRFLSGQQVRLVVQVRPHHLWSYLESLTARGLKDTSVHAAARAARTFFNFCVTQQMVDFSPMAKVEMPRLAHRILPSFPSHCLHRLIEACGRTRDEAIVLFLLDTGCRASELLNLRWRDVDLKSGRTTIRSGKGRKDRVVFVGEGTRHQLNVYRKESRVPDDSDTPIWLNLRTGQPLTASGLRQMLERLGKRANVANCSPHTFRRTFAIESLRKGIDLYTLARLMGHNDISVLRVYLDFLEDDLIEAQNRYGIVDRLLSDNGASHVVERS